MKAQVEFQNIENEFNSLKVIAIQNGYSLSRQGLMELAFKIASNCTKYLDKDSFTQVTGFKI